MESIEILNDGVDKTAKKILLQHGISNRAVKTINSEKILSYKGKIVTISQIIKANEKIELLIKDEENGYEPFDLNLEVLFEDKNILSIYKPKGLCMHSYTHEINLTNGVSFLFKLRGLKRKIRFISRLDMDTEGIVLVAKNKFIQKIFDDSREDDTFKKYYLAEIEGKLEKEKDTIVLPIKQADDGIKYIVEPSGRNTITTYRVLDEKENSSIIEVELETGRTHQIRAVFAHLGHPLVGDKLYSKKGDREGQRLMAYKVEYSDALTGKKQTIEIDKNRFCNL